MTPHLKCIVKVTHTVADQPKLLRQFIVHCLLLPRYKLMNLQGYYKAAILWCY